MKGATSLKGWYRRNLPHLVRCDRPLFLTFTTIGRWVLPPGARTIALRHAIHDHGLRICVDVAIVMPDHMHMVFNMLHDRNGNDSSLGAVMKGIKGTSARSINKLLHRSGSIWLDESFDHVIRAGERSRDKLEYVVNNPVRAIGIVAQSISLAVEVMDRRGRERKRHGDMEVTIFGDARTDRSVCATPVRMFH